MTGIVVAFYATLQPLREDGLVRVVETIAPLAAASEVPLIICRSSLDSQRVACHQPEQSCPACIDVCCQLLATARTGWSQSCSHEPSSVLRRMCTLKAQPQTTP